MIEIKVSDNELSLAALDSMDAFVGVFVTALRTAIGGELTAETMAQLNSDQITLLAWDTLHQEVMDGGFIQLIQNGYGGFIFLNPTAKAFRLWGLKELTNVIYDGRRLYEQYRDELERDCTDEEFMALFERFPQFDDLDDTFVEKEEAWTEAIAQYIDDHLDRFATVV